MKHLKFNTNLFAILLLLVFSTINTSCDKETQDLLDFFGIKFNFHNNDYQWRDYSATLQNQGQHNVFYAEQNDSDIEVFQFEKKLGMQTIGSGNSMNVFFNYEGEAYAVPNGYIDIQEINESEKTVRASFDFDLKKTGSSSATEKITGNLHMTYID